ncbi:hypothetical protein QQS21_008798 [Conoideocrella luteorostrata]|uniref:Asteroid domain-containing protein n=1 Tax=Conoideocrella luteorostrata TaxID=1105319 RepID=A0AAJ0CKV8_9HYPO|nr:hypothetical protein QQS21_008798 [Conoideocrella luteorostrata]
MGIPQLYASLQPFSKLDILDGEVVVLDGPALAYHILYICRANGASQPSYALLGRVTITWLEKLAMRSVVVRSIYFDGYLPESKLEVRISRMMRSTSEISRLYVSNVQGCPIKYSVNDDREAKFQMFKTGTKSSRRLIDPCFLVPAVIDVLRNHCHYRDITYLVPGEADHFCASEVFHQGGIVITSDSDLLIHNLGHGRVAFFKDLQEDDMSKITFSSFVPRKIFEQLGLAYPEKAIQLAYERKFAPHATLSQIIRKCSHDPSHTTDYLKFREQYCFGGVSTRAVQGISNLAALKHLDPRVSELLVDLRSRDNTSSSLLPIRIFLPPLVECPELRSAWDTSTPIRQLAYRLADYCTLHEDGVPTVQEFRRVQSFSYRGRQVTLPSLNLARQYTKEILLCAGILKTSLYDNDDRFWIALAVALDKLESQRQDREPAIMTIDGNVQNPTATGSTDCVAWNMVHMAAQMQGTLYSLRMLQQVLFSVKDCKMEEEFPDMGPMSSLLAQLTPVERYPSTSEMIQAVRELGHSGTLMATGVLNVAHRAQEDH